MDLTAVAASLRAESHDSVSGHRQIALVRRGPVSLILFLFEQEGVLKEHRTEGQVTIQVLSGRLEITVNGKNTTLGARELLSLAPGEPHSVRAIEPSEMLLSICLT